MQAVEDEGDDDGAHGICEGEERECGRPEDERQQEDRLAIEPVGETPEGHREERCREREEQVEHGDRLHGEPRLFREEQEEGVAEVPEGEDRA